MTLGNETLIPLDQVRHRFPRRTSNRTLSYPSLWRFANMGINGVRLEVVKLGHVLYTSDEAVRRFITAVASVQRDSARRPMDQKPEGRWNSPTSTASGCDRPEKSGRSETHRETSHNRGGSQ